VIARTLIVTVSSRFHPQHTASHGTESLPLGNTFATVTYAGNIALPSGSAMKEILSTITSKGQVTIPAEVRAHLGLKEGDRVLFVLMDQGRVELKALKYPTVASLAGAAGRLSEPRDIEEMLQIAREDALERKFRNE